MNLDDYIEGTFNPDNPANQKENYYSDDDDEIDIEDIEVEDAEILEN